jgi:hypothetical protein
MQKRRRGGTLLAVVALLASCQAPAAEGPITLENFGHIGGPADDGGFEGLALISAPFSDGTRIAIVPWESSSRPVLIVGPDGGVTDTLATNGEGPGQVAHPVWAIRGLGDTAIIVDRGRIHFFAPDHRYVRSIPTLLGGTWSANQGPDGTIVLASNSVGGGREIVAGLSPLDGSPRFSIYGAPFVPGAAPENRFLALAPDGTWWTARAWGKYELQQYASDGRLLRTVALSAEWYPPYERTTDFTTNHAPNTALTGFWIDSLGRGWIVAQVADPNWAAAEGTMSRAEGHEMFIPKRVKDVRDGIIEVVDLETGQRLATLRDDDRFGTPAEPGVLYDWRIGEDGWVQIDLFRVVSRF